MTYVEPEFPERLMRGRYRLTSIGEATITRVRSLLENELLLRHPDIRLRFGAEHIRWVSHLISNSKPTMTTMCSKSRYPTRQRGGVRRGGTTVQALAIAAAAAALAAACSAEQFGASSITAEIHCETWISRDLGTRTDDLDFDHRPTSEDAAPSYSVTGVAVGSGQTVDYQCDTTFDGAETWTLDGLSLTPRT